MEAWNTVRADDFPPYATLFAVGLLFVPFFIVSERFDVPLPAELGTAVVLAVALCFLLLPRFKGAIIGLMWALGLSGRESL